MRFARIVYLIAGIWGVLIMTPLYFAYDVIGRTYPPPLTHPDIYFGFVGVTLVWQFAFLVIAFNPARCRPLMPITVLEKGIYVGTMAILLARGDIQAGQFAVVAPDSVLGALFVAAYLKTPK